jgi:hypothetical protein
MTVVFTETLFDNLEVMRAKVRAELMQFAPSDLTVRCGCGFVVTAAEPEALEALRLHRVDAGHAVPTRPRTPAPGRPERVRRSRVSTCGTWAAYSRGCRCSACKEAARLYSRERRARVLEDPGTAANYRLKAREARARHHAKKLQEGKT